MRLVDTFAIAVKAIRANTLRSILTTLGIIIGVASVIIMVAVGAGARQSVEERISQLGSNLLNIFPGSSRLGGRFGGAGTAKPLTEGDVRAIRALPGVAGVSGYVQTQAPIIAGAANWTTTVIGVESSYPFVRDWKVLEGRFFSEDESRRGARVAIIGTTIRDQLFQGSALGARIRISNVPMEVIGVMESRGQSSFGRDQDDVILVPLRTGRSRLLGERASTVPDQVQAIFIKAQSVDDLDPLTDEITDLMRVRRRIAPGSEDDFRVNNFADLIRARTATFSTLTWLLLATAMISLLVGGIGIMNIMLVSVTERTREIGLRMAVGARASAILMQFLVEAVTLCLIGGLIGLVIGVGGALASAAIAGWPIVIDLGTVILALVASGGVGIVFGYVPARRAARLNPIDALRHE